MNKHEQAVIDLYYTIPIGYPINMIGKTIQTQRLLDYINECEETEKEAEDMKAKVKAYLFSTNFDEERELYLELCILTKGSESK